MEFQNQNQNQNHDGGQKGLKSLLTPIMVLVLVLVLELHGYPYVFVDFRRFSLIFFDFVDFHEFCCGGAQNG